MVEYGEWLLSNVLKNVPYRQWVFSIPKRLRIYFLFDRKLLGKLSKCAWKVIRTYFEHAAPHSGIVPGASIVVQTYGDFLNFNPHLHAIVADGCFFDDNSFRVTPVMLGKDLKKAFQYEVLKMLKKEGKINDAIIENLLSWRHTGFHVYLGPRIWPDDHDALKDWRATSSGHVSLPSVWSIFLLKKTPDGIAKVIYTSKDGKSNQTFDALDWLPRLVTHVPGRYEYLGALLWLLLEQIPRDAKKSRCG